MQTGAKDWRNGQGFGHAVFFDENIDIHHIFPQHWCKSEKIKPAVFDSIINKTPLSFRTNRIIGGAKPSQYLAKLEKGDAQTPAIERAKLDALLRSHLVDPDLLRKDDFNAFMHDRQKRLLALIENAMGKPAYLGAEQEDGTDGEADADTVEADMVMTA